MSLWVSGKVNDIAFSIDLNFDQLKQYQRLLTDDVFFTSYIYEMVADRRIQIEGDTVPKITRFRGIEEQVIDDGSDVVINKNVLPPGGNDDSEGFDQVEVESNSSSSENNLAEKKVSTEFDEKETKYLLDKYGIYMQNMGPGKKFKNKKMIWLKISDKLFRKYGLNKTSVQIENKYKSVLRARKAVIKNNSTSGAAKVDMPTDMPFEDELKVIEALDDSVQPEILRSARNFKTLKPGRSTGVLKMKKKKAPKHDIDIDMTSLSSLSDESDEEYAANSNSVNKKKQLREKKYHNVRFQINKKKARTMTLAEAILESAKMKEIAKDRRHREKIKTLKQMHVNRKADSQSDSPSSPES